MACELLNVRRLVDSQCIDTLPLHDATLKHVVVRWSERCVEGHFRAFRVPDQPAESLVLTWNGVRDIQIPQRAPWGDSHFVNSARQRRVAEELESFEIEMQSGNVISVSAARLSVEWMGAP